MSRGIIAIDPGLRGAIALLIDGEYGAVHDMPIEEKKSGRNQVSVPLLIPLLEDLASRAERTYCIIEQVSAMPGQGVSSMFSLGDSFGTARAIACQVAHQIGYASPTVWKKQMGLTKSKGYSLTLARRYFPAAAKELALAKHEGRAEALLLAKYGGGIGW